MSDWYSKHTKKDLAARIEQLEAQLAQIEEWGREDLNALPDCLMKLAPALVRIDALEAELRKLKGEDQ